MPGAQLLGFALVLLGTLHFVRRDRAPCERSQFLGNVHVGLAARVSFAVVETAVGFAFLLTA